MYILGKAERRGITAVSPLPFLLLFLFFHLFPILFSSKDGTQDVTTPKLHTHFTMDTFFLTSCLLIPPNSPPPPRIKQNKISEKKGGKGRKGKSHKSCSMTE